MHLHAARAIRRASILHDGDVAFLGHVSPLSEGESSPFLGFWVAVLSGKVLGSRGLMVRGEGWVPEKSERGYSAFRGALIFV